MKSDILSQDMQALVEKVNRSDRMWLTYAAKNMVNRQLDQPNIVIDKLLEGAQVGEYALIIKSGSIPIFMKMLTGSQEDPVTDVKKINDHYKVVFRSEEDVWLRLL